jgi:hypothetical protein
MEGYVQIDCIHNAKTIQRLPTRFRFHIDADNVSIGLARQVLESVEHKLVDLHLDDRYCPALVVFMTDHPFLFTAADITLHDHPTLRI